MHNILAIRPPQGDSGERILYMYIHVKRQQRRRREKKKDGINCRVWGENRLAQGHIDGMTCFAIKIHTVYVCVYVYLYVGVCIFCVYMYNNNNNCGCLDKTYT